MNFSTARICNRTHQNWQKFPFRSQGAESITSVNPPTAQNKMMDLSHKLLNCVETYIPRGMLRV